MHDDSDDSLLKRGRFLEFRKVGKWEYFQRCNVKGCVAILAITDDRKVVLVEQYRPPLRRRTIELPAGLAGDIPLQEDEPLVTAARRELKEETGYEAKNWTRLTEGPSSSGITTEVVTFFYATGLTRMHEGGGDHTEDIRVHFVEMADVPHWCARREKDGAIIDFKIFAALYLARSQDHETKGRLWY